MSRSAILLLTMSFAPLNAACSIQNAEMIAPQTRFAVPTDFSGVVLVSRGGQILHFDGHGEVGRAQREKPFWVASVGKQFAAAALLKLVEQGTVRLEDPILRFFPSAPADKSAITVRQLLSHTSGFDQSYVAENQTDRHVAVAAMLAEPLAAVPGSSFRYSNSNTQLIAAIIELASGRSYKSFVADELFRPAGLRTTGFAGDRHSSQVLPISTALPQRLQRPYWGEQGAYSTAGDLHRWYRALADGRILRPETVQLMFEPAAKIGEGDATLGWFRGRTPRGNEFYFVRGNEDFGANALIYAYPLSDTVIIVLTHAGETGESSWSRAVHRSLEEQLLL